MDGDDLRAARQRLGLTQRQFGDCLNVDQGTVSRWERGVESPRPARWAEIRDLLLSDEERRHRDRCIATVRHDILPSTLLDRSLHLTEMSKSARAYFAGMGREPSTLIGEQFDRFADRLGHPELSQSLRACGFTKGRALLFRFAVNLRGAGHMTVWEPIFEKGQFAGALNYISGYLSFPANDEVTIEVIEFVPANEPDRLETLRRGARADLMEHRAGG